jgi:hypothetical protein
MRNPDPKFQQENRGRVTIFFVAAAATLALSMMTWRRASLDNTRVWTLWEQSNIESTADAAVIPPDLMPPSRSAQTAAPVASATPHGVAGMQPQDRNRGALRDSGRARDALLKLFTTSIVAGWHR